MVFVRGVGDIAELLAELRLVWYILKKLALVL